MDTQGQIPKEVEARLARRGADNAIALVGASTDPAKYGNIIIKNLRSKGYDVIPVNPREKEIEGLSAYPSLSAIDRPVGLVNFVVPPAVTLAVLKSISGSTFDAVWFQDGSYDERVLEYAVGHFEHVVSDACIMVVTNYA
jgi:uncharacterized protein